MKSTGIVRRVDELGRIVLPLSSEEVLISMKEIHLKFLLTTKGSFLRNMSPLTFSREAWMILSNIKARRFQRNLSSKWLNLPA